MNEAKRTQTVPNEKTCPQCGVPLPAGALAGLCPACLLQQGATADTGTDAKQPPFIPPTIPELAPLFPQLEILALLGQGGMGAVYKARQPALDRIVALKILPSQAASGSGFAERFNREARALARLSHPNIVAVYDFGQVSSGAGVPPAKVGQASSLSGAANEPTGTTPAPLHYFLMEFVDGVNLRQLEQASRLSPREALQIIPQICDALQYAHDEGVVHRDIKPENVLVDRKGRVKIADFGLAKIMAAVAAPATVGQTFLSAGSEDIPVPVAGTNATAGLENPADRQAGKPAPQLSRLTGEGQVMGTPHYMAPEQIEHPLAVDHRADIYSLGVVFYEMLTGELPLGRFAPPSRKVQVDVRLDEVVLHALEKEPERRYQQASQVKTAVETIVSSGSTGVPPAEPTDAPSGKRSWLISPLSSPEVNEITAHLTKAERSEAVLYGLLWGVWVVAATSGNLFLLKSFPAPGNWIVASVVAVLFIASLPPMLRMQRRFLSSTAWAKERGYDANQIKLFSFSRQNLWAVLLFAGVAFLLVFGQSKLFTHLSGVSELTANLKEDAARTKEQRARLAAQAKNNTLTFGPVIELTLTVGMAIDFEAGQVMPQEWEKRQEIGPYFPYRSMRERGLDALCEFTGHLAPADMKVKPFGNESWDTLDPEQLSQTLRAINPVDETQFRDRWMDLGTNGPTTYGFQTGNGVVGLLQLTFITNNPLRVKLRYKLVHDPGAATALQFRLVAPEGSSEPADLLSDPPGHRQIRVLREVLLDGAAVARAGMDFVRGDARSIRVQFTPAGTRRFNAVTATNVGRQLAIVFREQMLSAPIIRTPICEGQVQIAGDFSAKLAHTIVDALNRASVPTEQAWTFTAPREQTVPALKPPDSARAWLDLDAGILVTNQSVDWETRAGADWIRTNGFDLVATVSSRQLPVLTGFDLVVTPAPTNGWESVSATDVVQDWTLMQTEPQTTSTFGVAPGGSDCFLVQTREGGRGILQILGVTEDGRAVKVRYKLAQKLTAAKPPGLSSIEEDINAAFGHLNGLQDMKPGQHYELAVGGRKEIGIPDDFLRRRTGPEILASGWSSGCGDYALAFVHLMERRGYQTLLVDSAEISLSSLESHFAGHVVVAVRDTADAGWALVDPTNKRTLSNNWSVNDKTFYGDRYWIGYCGPPADYPVHGPEELKEFYAKTLSRIPRDFWNHHLFGFNFKVDSSLLANDGSCLNPNIPELARNQERALARFGIRPEKQITILLVKGGNDDKSTLTYSGDRGWVCTLGLQSACSLGLVSYMQERAASTMPR